jgi:SAM-dependent methyltransferase
VVAGAAVRRGAIATGLDFSPEMLAIARARHQAITFDHGDAEALPYDDAAFDAVVSNFGIHHVPRPIQALRESYRVLRAGGRFAFTIWAAPADNIAWKLLFDAVARHGNPAASDTPAPSGGFATPDHCVIALRDAGFSGIATRMLRGTWHHPDGASLVAALRAGTARMAAMIVAQSDTAMPAIIADIDAHAAPYRDASGLAVPIAAWVASGIKAGIKD